jgi:hypothetical protein
LVLVSISLRTDTTLSEWTEWELREKDWLEWFTDFCSLSSPDSPTSTNGTTTSREDWLSKITSCLRTGKWGGAIYSKLSWDKGFLILFKFPSLLSHVVQSQEKQILQNRKIGKRFFRARFCQKRGNLNKEKAEDRCMGDFLINKEVWEDYKFKNYYSDMSPGTRFTATPRYHPLEFFNVYGWWRSDAWNRFFFNEA